MYITNTTVPTTTILHDDSVPMDIIDATEMQNTRICRNKRHPNVPNFPNYTNDINYIHDDEYVFGNAPKTIVMDTRSTVTRPMTRTIIDKILYFYYLQSQPDNMQDV